MDLIKDLDTKVIKVPDPQALSLEALHQFISAAHQAIQRRGRFMVALSGGTTPDLFYQHLYDSPESREIDWTKVQLFWVDERAVGPESEASNYHLAATRFIEKVAIPPENVHRMVGESTDLTEAAHEYEQTIREVFNTPPGQIPHFDLVVLGMGADGHIASLLPGSYALMDTDDLVTTVFHMEEDWSRITLTVPVLLAAKQLMVLVSGSEKAGIVREIFQTGPDAVKYPAHALWPVLDRVTWILDEPAGRLL